MSSPSAPASAAGALAIDIRQLPWIRRLATDYASQFDTLAPFYAGDPQQPEAWRAIVSAIHAGPPRATARLAGILRGQQTAREAPAAAIQATAAFADPRAVAVVTGQQAGLFGGPLYTLLKAITAIKLARQLSKELDVPAVPVFWVDSEDHDWAEVRACTVLDDTLAPRTVTLGDVDGAGTRPIGRLVLDDGAPKAIDELAAVLPPTEFSGELLAALRKAYVAGRSMADAFARTLEHLLGAHGLVVYDASDPATKPLVRDLFLKAIADPGQTAALATGAGVALERLGYHAQVTSSDQSLPLFAIGDSRQPIKWRERIAIVGDREMSLDDLSTRVASSPDGFSPNVLLRPLVQDTIFPTACYVGGPSELAYLGQLRQVYAHFGVPMPLVAPRASASIVDSATVRFLGKHDVPFAAFQRQDDLTLNQLLESQLPAGVEQSFAQAGSAIVERLEAVTAAARVVDATLEGAAKATLGKMQRDLQTLHGKVVHAAKRKDDTLRRQFVRAQSLLFPHGHPQEREIAAIWLLNRYGPAAVDRLIDVLPVDPSHHWVLAI